MSELASLAGQNSPPSSSHQSEKHTATVSSARGDVLEVVPRLHAKTYLAVFTVCLIYYAQLVNLVGAGAVCETSRHFLPVDPWLLTPQRSKPKPLPRLLMAQAGPSGSAPR